MWVDNPVTNIELNYCVYFSLSFLIFRTLSGENCLSWINSAPMTYLGIQEWTRTCIGQLLDAPQVSYKKNLHHPLADSTGLARGHTMQQYSVTTIILQRWKPSRQETRDVLL